MSSLQSDVHEALSLKEKIFLQLKVKEYTCFFSDAFICMFDFNNFNAFCILRAESLMLIPFCV
jgi:hypothetical protein